MAETNMRQKPHLNKPLMDQLNRIPWRCLIIPGSLLSFLGIYTCFQMIDYTQMPQKSQGQITAFAHVAIFFIGVMITFVGFVLCATWYYMWDKRFMPLAEAEQQRRDMAAARDREHQLQEQRPEQHQNIV
ncbi:hypothetical protein PTRG_07076 [Pyrenophora tritici-repentis Pt-1C-BFP]|uniref:Uncharacterized protein n=1 Tax=Pyrenophora tritici-repentis (strain Pt-1C-BFP) TaxID=426418 RepID=B2WBR3_PYRTR|nr:uncharacterized protein PTRG_07076 [Pyrenophora tritici-repentis Pt-1C-BFP]EDU49995.1 hypothetical protein PTRG_07076 [Pyrenophora tritici-repentis Pt-1C-BFP]